MNLYNLQAELLSIFAELEENGGELTPELEKQLEINQQDCKQQVKNFVDYSKMMSDDITAIDKEIARLTALKKDKNLIIERVAKIVINAIETFGDTTKSGSRYIDYGTGKVSIRNSTKVEVNEDFYKGVVSEFASIVNFMRYSNTLDTDDKVDTEDLIKQCEDRQVVSPDNEGDGINDAIFVNETEIDNIKTTVVLDVNLSDLMKGEGFNMLRHIVKTCPSYSIKPVINKTELKSTLNTTPLPNIAKFVPNKTLTIK